MVPKVGNLDSIFVFPGNKCTELHGGVRAFYQVTSRVLGKSEKSLRPLTSFDKKYASFSRKENPLGKFKSKFVGKRPVKIYLVPRPGFGKNCLKKVFSPLF